MKASSLFQQLQALMAVYGDEIDVWLHDPDTGWILDITLAYSEHDPGERCDSEQTLPHLAVQSGYDDALRIRD